MSIHHDDHDHKNHQKNNSHGESEIETGSQRDKRYWRSLEEWGGDPEFQKMAETEFMSSPLRDGSEQEGQDGFARREFLKLMGASVAMATAGCIRRPIQKIVPYNKQPEEVTHGVPNIYTSTWSDGVETLGLLVKSREGRPTKVEGNPSHPGNRGALSARAQAHILSLYDPERLKGPKKNLQNKERTNRETINIKWEDLDNAVVKQLKKGSAVILTGNIASPTTRALISDFCQGTKANHVVWEPLTYEAQIPDYHFDKAKLIISVDADFLGTWISPVAFTRSFSDARRDPKTMAKLVVFDSAYTLTGANADIRVRIKPSQQLDVLMGLAHELSVKRNHGRYAGNAAVKTGLSGFADVPQKLGISPQVWGNLADELIANRGQSLVLAGGMPTMTEKYSDVQLAAALLNSILDNDGVTIDSSSGLAAARASNSEFLGLIEDMKAKKVKTIIIHKTNPVYTAINSEFEAALKNCEMVIYTGDRIDETGRQSDYMVPDNHPLETWGDGESFHGAISIQQPTIRPLYDTRSFQLTLMTWAFIGETGPKRLTTPETFYDYLRAYWKDEIHGKAGKGQSFDDFWDEALQTGVVSASHVHATAAAAPAAKSSKSAKTGFNAEGVSGFQPAQGKGLELVLYPTIMFRDGTTLNNVSWLHELPDPVTKIVWDNYASFSMATAEKLHLREGDVVELKVGNKKLKLPTHIQPGLHDDVVAVAVGYGRTAAGKVGNGVGGNAYTLVNYTKDSAIYSGQAVEVTKTGDFSELACTGGHNSMEGRKIVAEATKEEYLKNEDAHNHKHQIWNIWPSHQYNGSKWGMAVDLNTCTGCSACIVACQSENNITVVGKKYVLQGREMHWMRIDRYFVGDPKDAHAVFQPVMCQHCDNAPCESVCPVMATVHSDEGLNDMVYNRCVGTRYCSNNCPYKVRRFNWFNYAKLIEKPMHLALNPEVTVRPRGVMEKCTFCTHRIKEAKIKSRVENRSMKDGDVTTACEQTCPANAIIFGDLNDPNSRVAKIFREEKRAYALLEEFNAAPAVRYMTKVRNNYSVGEGKEEAGHGGHS